MARRVKAFGYLTLADWAIYPLLAAVIAAQCGVQCRQCMITVMAYHASLLAGALEPDGRWKKAWAMLSYYSLFLMSAIAAIIHILS